MPTRLILEPRYYKQGFDLRSLNGSMGFLAPPIENILNKWSQDAVKVPIIKVPIIRMAVSPDIGLKKMEQSFRLRVEFCQTF